MIGHLWDKYVGIVDRVGVFIQNNFTYLAILLFILMAVTAMIISISELTGG